MIRALGPRQRELLEKLADRSPQKAPALAAASMTAEASAATLKRLERRGFVERENARAAWPVSVWTDSWTITLAGRARLHDGR